MTRRDSCSPIGWTRTARRNGPSSSGSRWPSGASLRRTGGPTGWRICSSRAGSCSTGRGRPRSEPCSGRASEITRAVSPKAQRPQYQPSCSPITCRRASRWMAPETDIQLHSEAGQLRRLAGSPDLRWVSRLDIRGPWENDAPVEEEEIAKLIASPYLTGLHDLEIARLGLTVMTAQAIRKAGALRSLEYLDLSGNRLGRAGGLVLAQCEHLTNLRHLDLSGNRVGNVVVQALLDSLTFRGLKSMDVSGFRLTPEVSQLLKARFPDNRRE
jgi:Leucine Rich repeats (2 copies)